MTAPPDLPAALRELADLREIRGALLEADDLRRTASAIETLGPDGSARVARLVRRGRYDEALIPGQARSQVHELVVEGAASTLRAARESIPFLLRRLLDLAAVTPGEARTLCRTLGVVTLDDLERQLDAGGIARTLNAGTARQLAAAARALAGDARPTVLGRAVDIVESILASLASTLPGVAFEISGDVRRFEPFVSSLCLVAAAVEPDPVLNAVCAVLEVQLVLHRGPRRCVLLYREAELDVRVPRPEDSGTVMFVATGSREHVGAVLRRHSDTFSCPTESEIYARAGLAFTPAELRQDSGEIEAAAAGALPRLVTREDVRGDLHVHTVYSDGRDSVEEMIAACARLGYEYIAITDHSEGAAAARTLQRDDIARQREEIARVRERFPQMRVLHGVEVDILGDGRLDFDDAILERFDIVLASLHERLGHDARQLTARCLAAIRHPLVTVLTHPQNRIPGQRGDYPLDFEAVFAAAAEAGTALEVDGSPGHLDLDGDHARAAIAAGVTLVVDSDCHRARLLERQMRLGIGTARRGWVEPRHVLNTGSADALEAFIARKRSRTR